MNTIRKKIGVITCDPENFYERKILEGIFKMSEQYNYDVLVFTTYVKANHRIDRYLRGEANIYNVINFDRLDGIILITLSFKYHNDNLVYNHIRDLLRKKCHCPVISVDETMDDYEYVKTEDTIAFEKMTDHVIEEHNCKKIYFLAGDREANSSQMRVRGFKNSLKKHGMEIREEDIIYGEFWYTFGERFAQRLATGDLVMPDAVMAASDYIGIGFMSAATRLGYRIPDDFIVTGFDGVIESRASDITLTSYVPPISETGAEAFVRLVQKIEKKKFEFTPSFDGKLVTGMSCGCCKDCSGKREKDDYGYLVPYTSNEIDLRKFMGSYMAESLTESRGIEECCQQIMKYAYLVENNGEYVLCTCKDWENADENDEELYSIKAGYTQKMKISVYRCAHELIHEWVGKFDPPDPYLGKTFDSSEMLPKIFENKREVPAVFYFTPVHFNGRRIGYSVSRFAPSQAVVNFIFQIWSRYVNNALEMMRVRKLLFAKSTRDSMTGLYNRNSLKDNINSILEKAAASDDEIYVEFVDMNSLKYINDEYGHDAGDAAITTLAGIISSVCIDGSVCVRLGGDEFIIIGYSGDARANAEEKIRVINARLDKYNSNSSNSYRVTASFGACCRKAVTYEEVEVMIKEADEKMYQYKTEYKKKNNIQSNR